MSKVCSVCHLDKELDEFSLNAKGKFGRYSKCKACVPKAIRTPDQTRGHKLQNRYGISSDEYDAMLKAQNGVCAICGLTCATGRRLAVDHDHETGKVRGLLCLDCNVSLGKMKDSPDLLLSAAMYLIQHEDVLVNI